MTPPDAGRERTAWADRPGAKMATWIVGVVGVVVALASLAVSLANPSSGDNNGDASGAAARSSSTLPQPSSSPVSAPQETASLPPDPTPTLKIRWKGDVTFDYWRSIDLDTLPPTKETDDTTEDGQVGFNQTTIVGNLFALWTGDSSPTYQGCSDLVSTQGESRVKVAKGEVICLETSEGRTALLKVRSFRNGTVAAYTIVWDSST